MLMPFKAEDGSENTSISGTMWIHTKTSGEISNIVLYQQN